MKINAIEGNFVIDTGASNTVLDKSRSSLFIHESSIKKNKKLSSGLGTDKMKSELAKKQRIEIGNLQFKHTLVLLDLSHINHSYQSLGFKAIDGVLGCDILVKYKAIINLKNKAVTLHN